MFCPDPCVASPSVNSKDITHIRIRHSAEGSVKEHLREQLRARLRVAAEFATLGAYELLEPGGTGPRGADARQEIPVRQALPQRVLLFAKVAPATCPQRPAEDRIERCSAVGGRRSAREGMPRRGGSVSASEQACTWAGSTG